MQRHFNNKKPYCLEDFGLGQDYFVLRIRLGRLKVASNGQGASLVSGQDIRSSHRPDGIVGAGRRLESWETLEPREQRRGCMLARSDRAKRES
jgi:hypothetical protein